MSLESPDTITQLKSTTTQLSQQGTSFINGEMTQGYDNSKISNDIGITNDKLMIKKQMKDGYYPEYGDIIYDENGSAVVGWGDNETIEGYNNLITYEFTSGVNSKSFFIQLTDIHYATIVVKKQTNIYSIDIKSYVSKTLIKTAFFSIQSDCFIDKIEAFKTKTGILIIAYESLIFFENLINDGIPVSYNLILSPLNASNDFYMHYTYKDNFEILHYNDQFKLYFAYRNLDENDFTTLSFDIGATMILQKSSITIVNTDLENATLLFIIDYVTFVDTHIKELNFNTNELIEKSYHCINIGGGVNSTHYLVKGNKYTLINIHPTLQYWTDFTVIINNEDGSELANVSGNTLLNCFYESENKIFFLYLSFSSSSYRLYDCITKTLSDEINLNRTLAINRTYQWISCNNNNIMINTLLENYASYSIDIFTIFPNTTKRLGPCLAYNQDTREATMLIEGIDDSHKGLLVNADYYVDNYGKLTLDVTDQYYGKALRNNRIAWLNQKLIDALAGKEPVFTKNSAFNKSFGSSATNVSPGNHVHDDRYFTETEINTALAGKESTFSKNSAFNKNFGSTAGTTCQGNDTRLSDSRTCNNTFDVASVESDIDLNTKIIPGIFFINYSVDTLLNRPADQNGTSRAYSLIVLKGDVVNDVKQILIRTHTGDTWIRTWNGILWQSWAKYAMEYHDHSGFTRLGSDSPKIKMKVLSGMSASTEGGIADIAHGISASSKIISVSVKVNFSGTVWISETGHVSPYYFYHSLSDTFVRVVNKASESGSILSKPLLVFIVYQE